jgi:hypothetical protein
MSPPTEEELSLVTQLIRDHSIVEVPGKWNRTGNSATYFIVLPETITLSDFIPALACKK